MKRLTVTMLPAMLMLASAMPVGADETGAVTVHFQAPEKFTDVKERQFKTAPEKNANLSELKKWLEKRANKYLQPGQHLEITLNDIDLAGAFEPWQDVNLQDVRIVKDLYPPRMKLHFRLTGSDGAVVNEGDRDLRNLGFMMESSNVNRDALEHDKGLLDDWLKKEFPGEQ